MSSETGPRIVITGATGHVGSSLVRLLTEDAHVSSILGLARRIPDWSPAKTEWSVVELASDQTDLTREFEGSRRRRPSGMGVPAHA